MIQLAECTHPKRRKHGRTKANVQRYRCSECGKCFTESTDTLNGMRIGLDRAEMILKCLFEGMSVNSVSRITNTDPHTIYDLIVLIGGRCKRFMESTIHNVHVDEVQADEIWSFISCKEKTRKAKDLSPEFGDAYCWTAIERNTKLFVCWHLGKRTQEDAHVFTDKLVHAVHPQSRFQYSTDGLNYYGVSANQKLVGRVDYGRIIKTFGKDPKSPDTRYSPSKIIKIRKQEMLGMPKQDRITTSHCERANLTIRMEMRRFTRLTNAFSKKWENHEAALSMFFCHYNWCRKHATIRTSPAVESGLADRIWSVRDLIQETSSF